MMEVLMWCGAYMVGMAVTAAVVGFAVGGDPDDDDAVMLIVGSIFWPLALPILLGLGLVIGWRAHVKAKREPGE